MSTKEENIKITEEEKKKIEEKKAKKKEKKAKKKEKKNKKKNKQGKNQQGKQKKVTGLKITAKKNENFAEWYQQVITKSEMIDYYDVSGCYVFRPASFQIWENIQSFMEKEFKKLGVKNCYFPLFVTKRALELEKEHVEGFAPEVAWVTKSGSSDLAEPIAIRPTSETVMYPHYANWIRSHKDLPLKLNQWCNVVRWEFKNPIPFIRGREFLWQEGHTAHETQEEGEKEVYDILDIYSRVYEELCAVPVTKGIKSEMEKFAGGSFTSTVESFVSATGRSIQSATSHCLGQNFSKMFNIEFENEKKEKAFVWQNSWGLSTRSLGVIIMIHGDDRGLVLPPRVAPLQMIIVPVIFKKDKDPSLIMNKAKEYKELLEKEGLRVDFDNRENYTPGWKYNYWELKGIPIRIEIGARDLENKKVVMCRRDTGKKENVEEKDIIQRSKSLLDEIHNNMFERAKKEKEEHRVLIKEWKDFVPTLLKKNVALVPWCNRKECEQEIKEKSKKEAEKIKSNGKEGENEPASAAKSLCMPLDQKEMKDDEVCFACGKKAEKYALFGYSY